MKMVKLRSLFSDVKYQESHTDQDALKLDEKEQSEERKSRPVMLKRALEFRHLHKVFLAKSELKDSSFPVKVIPLRNPCTKLTSRYICQHQVGRYYEIMKYYESNRSWFVDDVLTIDGSIFMTILIDPLFLVLPYLQAGCSDRFAPLDNVLKDEKYPEISAFVDALPMTQFLMLCDHTGPADLKAVKFNEEKTLHWLAYKCDKFIKKLEEKKFYVEGGAKSETYIKSEKLQTDPDVDARLTYCIEVINEYIPRDMQPKLLTRLGVEVAKATKRKPTKDTTIPSVLEKRARDSSASDSPPATPKEVVEKKQTAREKAMTKAAAGTKNIMSFFKKK